MNNQLLVQKLTSLTSLVIGENKAEFTYVFKKFGFGVDELLERVLFYTLDLAKVSNKDYFNSFPMRACMRMHMLAQGSYHGEKNKAVQKILSNSKIKSIIEFGFGIPSDYVFASKNQRITLTDFDPEAIAYSKAILEHHNPNYAKNVDFKLVDLNTGQYPGDYDAYVFLDSLEHVDNPTEHLRKLVSLMPTGAHLVTSLPIAKIDMMAHAHHIEFRSATSIVTWLESAGLIVVTAIPVTPNPAVDFFASQIEGGYVDLLTDSIKI